MRSAARSPFRPVPFIQAYWSPWVAVGIAAFAFTPMFREVYRYRSISCCAVGCFTERKVQWWKLKVDWFFLYEWDSLPKKSQYLECCWAILPGSKYLISRTRLHKFLKMDMSTSSDFNDDEDISTIPLADDDPDGMSTLFKTPSKRRIFIKYALLCPFFSCNPGGGCWLCVGETIIKYHGFHRH